MVQMTQRALTASTPDGKLFADRADELAAIERAVGLGFNVYVAGQPGSGKTSLLHRVQARLGDRAVYTTVSRSDSFGELIEQLAVDLDRLARRERPGDGSVSPARRGSDDGAFPPVDALLPLWEASSSTSGTVVLVDGLTDRLHHDLFSRLRDELWEIPVRWVVSGRTGLTPPADAFFETTVWLGPLDRGAMGDLLRRRAATGTAEQAAVLHRLAEILPDLLEPTTPRHVLAVARSVLLGPDGEAALAELRDRQKVRADVSPTAERVLAALEAFGPTHAGDERLLSEIGTSRARVAQVMRELEEAGLVRSARHGKRKLYGPNLAATGVHRYPEDAR